MNNKSTFFPDNFLWGVATAGHQVEGNNVNSDIWLIVRDLGLNAYRFSLEWARIEPTQGEFSQAMLDHYKRMINGCRSRNLTPVVTFNHFSSPRWFAALGGWEVSGAPHHFARFCERAARHLAKEIGYALTLNEPNILRLLKWLTLPFPPGLWETQTAMLAAAARVCGTSHFSAANAGDADAILRPMIAGHKAGYAAIKNVCPDLPVGVSLALVDDQAVGNTSRRDAKRNDVYGAWLEAAKTGDFIGVQNYSRQRLDENGPLAAPPDAEMNQSNEEGQPTPRAHGTVRAQRAGCAGRDDVGRDMKAAQA